MSLWRWIVPLVLVAAVGCGPRVTPVTTPPPTEALKAILEKIAAEKPGAGGADATPMGSAAGAMFTHIDAIKKTHPEQGAALEQDAKKLMPIIASPRGPGSPEAQKLAKEMLKKLESVK